MESVLLQCYLKSRKEKRLESKSTNLKNTSPLSTEGSIHILLVRPLLQTIWNCYPRSLQTDMQNPANIHLQGQKCNIC